MSDEAMPKRGRPSKGKRGTFTFRVTGALRAKLEAEAAADGRPVSEIIEMRLERSFEADALKAQLDRIERAVTPAPVSPFSHVSVYATPPYNWKANGFD